MSVDIFTRLLQYFPKNRAILVQKLGEEKKFSAILRLKKKKEEKKVPMATKLEGLKALMAWPLVYELFCFFAASKCY